jgi:hypothetical protein
MTVTAWIRSWPAGWRSRNASSTASSPASICATTASVRASGVPWGSSTRASMMSPSTSGKPTNLSQPATGMAMARMNSISTRPTVR